MSRLLRAGRVICKCFGHKPFKNWRNGMQKAPGSQPVEKYGRQADKIILHMEGRVECRRCDWVSASGWRDEGSFPARGGTEISHEVEAFERGEIVWTDYGRRPAGV